MGRLLAKASLFVLFALAAAACSGASSSGASSPSSAKPPAPIPTKKTVSRPVTYGYYDGHVDKMLSTDVTSKSQAGSLHINYSAALNTAPAKAFPALYMVSGRAAPNQPVVFSTEPGEADYSPLWDET